MPPGPLGEGKGVPAGPQVVDGITPAGGYRCFAVTRPVPGVVEIALNRTAAMNAMSSAFIREMHQLCDALQYPQALPAPAPRVLIIRGEGRAFCAGLDLRDPELQGSDLPMLQHAYSAVVRKLRDLPQPIVAGLNGAAVGGGMALALAADVRVATERCRLVPAMVRLGLGGGDCGTSWFLPRIVGRERAALTLLTGQDITAATALEWGLVSRVVPDTELAGACRTVASAMLTLSPKGLRLTKSLLNGSQEMPLATALEREDLAQSYMSADQESRLAGMKYVQRHSKDSGAAKL